MYLFVQNQPFNIFKISKVSDRILSGKELEQKFDYKTNNFKPTYGFIIYEGVIEHQVGCDNKKEVEKCYAYVQKELKMWSILILTALHKYTNGFVL